MVTTIATTTTTTLLLLPVLVLDLAVLLDGGHAGRQGHTATAGRLEEKHGGTGEGREGREKNEASTTGKRTIEGGRIGVKSAQEKADREWGGRNADVRGVAEGWWRGWGSLSVYLYSQRPGWVKEALEVGQQGKREGVRKVVVVCSALHILHILRQVRDNTLESVRLRWYVVLRGEVDVPGVLDAVREGTQVALAVRQGLGIYRLYSTFLEVDNTLTYSVVVPEDGQWGKVLDNGTVTGMIGMVASHRAQLAINEITINDMREDVVDFTFPYYLESTVIVTQAPAARNRAFAVLLPFTLRVWMLVVASTLTVGPALACISRARNRLLKTQVTSVHPLSHLSFNAFRSLLNQSSPRVPDEWPLRMVVYSWSLFCITIYAMYAGTLTAELARPAHVAPINSLVDLLRAIHTRGYKMGLVEGTSVEGMLKVLTGPYAFLIAQLGSEMLAERLGRQRFHMGREHFYPQSYGIVCTTGSPLTAVLERILRRMAAAGLVQKWTKDEKVKVEGSRGNDEKGTIGAITIKHLQAAYFFLLLGYILSVLAFLLEWLKHNRDLRLVSNRRPFALTYPPSSYHPPAPTFFSPTPPPTFLPPHPPTILLPPLPSLHTLACCLPSRSKV
ncbi:hypothetical protein Pcinc_004552 [Petrolisthes cinctipes]|uniref:Ionotropic glutamate receptor C-terminal domain-containing protein n=1 Tax=Petrolisthes cinctipes TaxID=88211 RepID=A0AAE1GFC2_PETCI|nr:hypothetical protein Pcinc_004552 [Petrolisthes cinctipes]